MEKKEITTVNPIKVAEVTLIPISKTSINYWHSKRGAIFSGSKQPVSIIIATPTERRAFRITGEEITLIQLSQEFPDILEKLEEI